MCNKNNTVIITNSLGGTSTKEPPGKEFEERPYANIVENKDDLSTSKVNDYELSKPPNSYGEHSPIICMKDHFSSLLFGGSKSNTFIELLLITLPFASLAIFGNDLHNVKGSMPFFELATFFAISSVVRRVYNAYLEAVYFTFPRYRTQPPRDHSLKKPADLCGRDIEQLRQLDYHDKITLVSQFALNIGLYFLLPGFYPSVPQKVEDQQTLYERLGRLLLNHFVLSFGMYWMHRSFHVIPFLWKRIHSFHHWAKHPLSRNTFEDHWIDNFANAVVGHVFAQILVPLDNPTFWFSRFLRLLESLEKHSGTSCGYNLAHSLQQWLPFAQMPHHHDWHHEGFKGSNYSFSSIGGLWDCLFGTRKSGRYRANNSFSATRMDLSDKIEYNLITIPSWFSPIFPLVALSVLVIGKLMYNLE